MGNSAIKECSKCGRECPTDATSCIYCASIRVCKVCNTNINNLPTDTVYCLHCDTVIKLGQAQISSIMSNPAPAPTTVPGPHIMSAPTLVQVIPIETPTVTITSMSSTPPIDIKPVPTKQYATGKVTVTKLARTCETCNVDISESPTYYKLCKVCYKQQLVEKTCFTCNRPFKVTKQESYKQMCGRSDCVKLDDDAKKRVKAKLSKDGYSKKSIVWLRSIMEKEKINIQHELNGGEHKLKTKAGWKKVDGYHEDAETGVKTAYEFYGTYYHGSPDITTHHQTGVDGRTYEDLYNQTLRREKAIREAGYNVVVMFESDYDKL